MDLTEAYKKIKANLDQQEAFILRLQETLDSRGIKWIENSTWKFERAKMIGMIEIARLTGLNITSYSWIF